jgi:hypothetical protein
MSSLAKERLLQVVEIPFVNALRFNGLEGDGWHLNNDRVDCTTEFLENPPLNNNDNQVKFSSQTNHQITKPTINQLPSG